MGVMEFAKDALARGITPIPIPKGKKAPTLPAWTTVRYLEQGGKEDIEALFEGDENVGVLLGEPSQGLIDVDVDNDLTRKLAQVMLPDPFAVSGRTDCEEGTHYWYRATTGTVPTRTVQYAALDGGVSIELRSTGAQTVVPPSVHPSGASYMWKTEPWGGADGIPVIDGRALRHRVAYIALVSGLLEVFQEYDSRNTFYLRLSGSLLSPSLERTEGVCQWWDGGDGGSPLERLVHDLTLLTQDEDGGDARVAQCVEATRKTLVQGRNPSGLNSLVAEAGGTKEEIVKKCRILSRLMVDVASTGLEAQGKDTSILDGFVSHTKDTAPTTSENATQEEEEASTEEESNYGQWAAVDLLPFISGTVEIPEPTIMRREDGHGLMYPGVLNYLFGRSESAKSWVAMAACAQEAAEGSRVMYLDFEDSPVTFVARFRALGLSDTQMATALSYVHPEMPLAAMQKSERGNGPTAAGKASEAAFAKALKEIDPALIVVDGMTRLFGLHGLNINDAVSTDVITTWLTSLTRGGRTTVLVIDHTSKNSGEGAGPIGSQHKIAMVQGTALRAESIQQPMPGKLGRVNLVVAKDRPGKVREFSSQNQGEQIAAEVVIDSRTEGVTDIQFIEPSPSVYSVEFSEKHVKAYKEVAEMNTLTEEILTIAFEGDIEKVLTRKEIQERLDISEKQAQKALKHLKESGHLITVGTGRETKYALNTALEGDETEL